MRKAVLLMASLLILASIAYAGPGCSEDDEAEVTWRLATFSMPGDIMEDGLQYFADQVNERSNGRMEIKIFTGGTLYQGTDIFDAVSAGNVEMGHVTGAWLLNKMPKYVSVYVQPWGNNTEERLLIQGTLFKDCEPIAKESQDNNIMTCLLLPSGELQWMFDRPVTVKEDLTGLHLWSQGSVGDPIIEAFGATPVVLDVSEIYMAAENGTINGMSFMSLDIYYNHKFYEVMPYLILGGGSEYGAPVLINSDSFEALPEDLQEIVEDVACDTQEYGLTAMNSRFDYLVAELEAAGVDIYVLPGDEATRWHDEVIYPILQGALYLLLTEDEIAQVNAVVAAVEAELAAGS